LNLSGRRADRRCPGSGSDKSVLSRHPVLTAEDFVCCRINRHQLTISTGGVQAFCLRIQRQTGTERASIGDRVFNFSVAPSTTQTTLSFPIPVM
jgi:hypothetical protein